MGAVVPRHGHIDSAFASTDDRRHDHIRISNLCSKDESAERTLWVADRRSGVGAAEAEAVVDLLEHGQQVVDLLHGVGGGELDPEADLLAGHHR